MPVSGAVVSTGPLAPDPWQMRGTRDRIGGQRRSRLGGRDAGEKGLQNHEPCRDQDDRAAAMRGKSGWHANLSHGTLAHLIFGESPVSAEPESNLMANRETAFIEITPEVLLKAYACGIFPMAESADDPALYWIEPEMRGIIPLDRFHMPARLARTVRSDRFTVTVNRDFDGVLEGCAEPQPGPPAHLDQYAHPRRSTASSTTVGIATASKSTRATRSSAVFTA